MIWTSHLQKLCEKADANLTADPDQYFYSTILINTSCAECQSILQIVLRWTEEHTMVRRDLLKSHLYMENG